MSLERLNVTLWSEESKRAAEHLHILGVNAQTAAERLGLLLNDPTQLPSYATTGQYQLDPGQKEYRTPSVTAPAPPDPPRRPDRFTPQYLQP